MNILLVEDSAVLRERLVRLIERSGEHRVVGWADREDEAIRRIVELKPGAAIFDIVLAQGSGIAALIEARRLVPGLIAIVMTNHPTTAHRRASLDAGAACFLDKARDLPRLGEILSSIAQPSGKEQSC